MSKVTVVGAGNVGATCANVIATREIADELAARSSAHEEFLAGIQKRIQDRLDEEGIRCTIYGRVKHIYSIYRKMFAQNKTLDEIFDLYAFRVIVDDIPECYNVLGGVDKAIPVDVYAPGCAVRPETIIDAVLQGVKILDEKAERMRQGLPANGVDAAADACAAAADAAASGAKE